MADKLVHDASGVNGGDAVARKPWSTPCVILSTVEGKTKKDFYHVGETHLSSGTSSSQQGGGAS